MGKMGLGYDDLVEGAGVTITAGSAVATLPPANVASEHGSFVWQTVAGVTTSHLLIDLGASRTFGAVFLGFTNLSATSTVRAGLSTVDATGVARDAYDSTALTGVDPDYGCWIHPFPSDKTGRYLRFDIVGGASLPYVRVGRAAALTLYRPLYNFQADAEHRYQDLSIGSRGAFGQLWFARRPILRGRAFTLYAVPDSERLAHVEPLLRKNGTYRNALMIGDLDSTNMGRDSVWGTIESLPPVVRAWSVSGGGNTIAFSIVERL